MKKFILANALMIALSVALNFLSGYCKSYGAPYLQKITDALTMGDTAPLFNFVLIGGVLTFSAYALRWLGAIVPNYLAEKFAFETRLKLFDHLTKIPFVAFEGYSKGELQSLLQNDSAQAGQVFYILLSRILNNVFLFILSIVVMAQVQPTATLVSVLIVVSATLVNQLILRRMKRHDKAAQKSLAEMTHSLERSFSGIQTVKTAGVKDYVIDDYQKRQDDYCENKLNSSKVGAFRTLWYAVTEHLCLYGSIVYLGILGINGVMSVGEVLMFVYLIKQIIMPVEVIFRWMSSLPLSTAGRERVQSILKTTAKPGCPSCLEGVNRLHIEHVHFAYEEGHSTLRDAELSLETNGITGLVGSSGSGKSTLLKIAAGLYDSNTMEITADGTPRHSLSPFDTAYSCLEQSVLPVTLYENIALGDPGIIRQTVLDTLTELGFAEWVASLPEGLDTVLHEGLSGGQKQAVANARVICSGRPLLIFDEPFSALDVEKEAHLVLALQRVKHEGMILVTSHRALDSGFVTHLIQL